MLPSNRRSGYSTNTQLEKNKEVFNSTGSLSDWILCLCFSPQCLLCPDYAYQPHCRIKPFDGSPSCNILRYRCFPVSKHLFGGGCRQHILRHYGAEETGNRISPARVLNILAFVYLSVSRRCLPGPDYAAAAQSKPFHISLSCPLWYNTYSLEDKRHGSGGPGGGVGTSSLNQNAVPFPQKDCTLSPCVKGTFWR